MVTSLRGHKKKNVCVCLCVCVRARMYRLMDFKLLQPLEQSLSCPWVLIFFLFVLKIRKHQLTWYLAVCV